MKTLMSFFLVLSLISCAKAPKDVELLPYLESFKALSGKELDSDNLTLQFGDLQAPIVGYCSDAKVVTIDKVYWETSPEELREEVVFHELGHCLLGRPHRTDVLSIMSPTVLSSYIYFQNRSYLLKELFNE